MSEKELIAFQKSIASEPEDDASRLVFADFLDEQDEEGYSEMAAFIRADIELSQTDEADARYPDLLAKARRAGVLTAKKRIPWLSSVPGARVTFRRGLISGVALTPQKHLKHSIDEWTRIPVRQLGWGSDEDENALTWTRELSHALSARPELSRLSTLVSTGGPTFLVPLLCGCPNLADLQALSIGAGWYLDDNEEEVLKLAEGLTMPSLDSLRIQKSAWPPVEWQPFVESTKAKLRRLHLEAESGDREWYESYNAEWFSTLSDVPLEYGVAFLDLGTLHSFGTTDEAWSLGNSDTLERVVMNASYDESYLDLSEWSSLRRLHVEMVFESAGAGSFSHQPEAAQLKWFSSNDVWGEEARSFSTGTEMKNLRRLILLTSDPEILQGEYCKRLHRLEWGNSYHDIDPQALLAAELPDLRWLTLRGCEEIEILQPLTKATNMPNLCTLLLIEAPEDESEVNGLVRQFAKASGLPNLSLVGTGRWYDRKWWVLGNGKATRVNKNVNPIWSDWWEPDPTDAWF